MYRLAARPVARVPVLERTVGGSEKFVNLGYGSRDGTRQPGGRLRRSITHGCTYLILALSTSQAANRSEHQTRDSRSSGPDEPLATASHPGRPRQSANYCHNSFVLDAGIIAQAKETLASDW